MNRAGRARALTRLQARRRQIDRELARVERQITQAQGQVQALQEQIASQIQGERRAS